MSDWCEITIQQGTLRGSKAIDIRGSTYFAFQGIPYAKSPIGELRFKAPQPPEKWNRVFDATKEGSSCIARDIHKNLERNDGSENCIVLNVYTKQFEKTLPVLFWIHGGGFIWGSSTTYEYGPDFLITEDVVVVSINYRLGLFGFLSLKDDSLGVPGNAGLKDMVMALKWVQNNISRFGGDPGNVTIFGESAGAMAVHLLTLSPMARGLFHKAISQSACALSPLRGRPLTAEIAKIANLGDVDDKAVLNYLKTLTSDEIFNIQNTILKNYIPNRESLIGVVVESSGSEQPFLTQEPIDIIKSGNFSQVPFIIGFTTAETMCFELFCTLQSTENINFENVVPTYLGYQSGTDEIKVVAEKIKKFYFENEEPSSKNIRKKIEMESDILFVVDIYKAATTQSAISRSPVFLYQMSIQSELNFLKRVAKATAPGVSHCDDLGYLFKNFMTPAIKPNSLEDIGMRRFVKMWTNFATFRNPTPQKSELLNVIWKPVKPNEVYYLDIGEKLALKINPEPARMQFWKNLEENCPAAKYKN